MLNIKSLRFIYLLHLFIFIFGCSETQDTFYRDIDAARKDSAIKKGWIPNILPESSTEIYERHNIDTNRVWIRFKFDKKDINELITRIEEVNPLEIETIKFINPDNVKWWPLNLNKDLFKINRKQVGLKIYKYHKVITYSDNRQKTIPSFFVIDWNLNIAYYWQYEF